MFIIQNEIGMNFSGTETELAYFTGIDYVVLVILLSLSLAIGIYFGFFSKKLKTAEDYLVGGHQMKPFPIAISLVARYIQRKERKKNTRPKAIFMSKFCISSQLSAITIVAVPAEVYSFGWHYILVVPVSALVVILVNYLFLPVFYHNNIDNCYVVSIYIYFNEFTLKSYSFRSLTISITFSIYSHLYIVIGENVLINNLLHSFLMHL